MFAAVPLQFSGRLGSNPSSRNRQPHSHHSSRLIVSEELEEKTPKQLAIEAAARQLDIANADLTSAERALKNAIGDNGKQEASQAKAAAFQAVQAARKALNIAKNS